MKYISTNHKTNETTFKEAVIQGLAIDGGLFYPTEIPVLPENFFKSLNNKSLYLLAYELLLNYAEGSIENDCLRKLAQEAFSFEIPLVEVEKDTYSLELFHGPTLAFKDVGARVTARFMSHFSNDKKLTILVATSGDTGSAVANGFLGIDGVDVVVLYPKGMVSSIQEKQFTTLGQNITALEINGTFDDCQTLVKEAFNDKDLRSRKNISSANSISIARFLPQMVYYFYAYAQLKELNKPLVFSVPSGNYGNLTAGLFAKKMGLPIDKFIASANINDVVPEYLKSGKFMPRLSKNTISNAMDVGNPSNFARILEMYDHDWKSIKKDITGYSFTDSETKKTMKDVFNRTGYVLDPHGAVAYSGLKAYQKENDVIGIFLETAHPAKFLETVEKTLSKKIEIPENLKATLDKKKLSIEMENSFEVFKEFLLSR
ncbi:MAG: threonine synthase [Bacteroidales bacterium]|nr:threonine synthase [Bacteroidales bacterium]